MNDIPQTATETKPIPITSLCCVAFTSLRQHDQETTTELFSQNKTYNNSSSN